ncbi:hypothetical protein ACFYXC_09005 [Streptomyces sp. NPDC002701]|uniref:hypothetical protein n=1 Tax=Streptomyces sp. NPDC002701 TaxID=3364661 RepID=UPI00367CB3D8
MRTTELSRLLLALGLFTGAAACGDESAGTGPAHDPERTGVRARQVSDAWEGSKAAQTWREGYFPLDDAVQLPEGAFRNEADKHAYETQNFELRAPLSADPPAKGKVRWRGGGSLTVPVSSARAAYEKLARGLNPGPSLVVTGARLGTMTLSTSRGPATVPAWHFTVAGYDTPLRRVAAGPSKLPPPPIKPVARTSDALHPLAGLTSVSADGRTVVLRAHHGSCDEGPAVDVLETGDNVVFSAWIRGRSDGPCTDDLRSREVTVELDRPAGDRLLLDAFTGRPVPYDSPTGSPAPSWD